MRAPGGVVERYAPGPVVAVPAPRVASRAAADAPRVLFAVGIVLGVAPVWLVAHVPTQDGAQHVESVMALLRLPHSPLLQQFYLANWGPQPNWLTQGIFAALVQVVSPALAEKLVLTGYLAALPLAFRAALPATLRARWAALLIFPFVHSYPFHMGFWNFCYSLVLFLLAVGFWYRRRGRLPGCSGVAFGALMLATFWAHSVSLSAALAAITAVLAWRGGLAVFRAGHRPARRARVLDGYVRLAAATYLWAAPAIALLGLFFVRQPKPLAYRPPILDYVKHFVSLYALVSLDRRELWVTGAVSVAIVGTLSASLWLRSARRFRPVDGWLLAALLASALYFMTPDSVADGAQLTDRLALYPFFAALLWLAWSSVPVRRVRALALVLVALFLAGTAMRIARYRQLDGYLAEYESVAPHVALGSVVLPLALSPYGPRAGGRVDGKKQLSYRVEVFLHPSGYVVTDREGVDLDNAQANTRHAPLRWSDEMNPFVALQTKPFGLEMEPPCVELWPYPALGGRIDYVLLWGDVAAAANDDCGAALLRELEAGWEPVFVSSPRGLARLYRPVRSASAAP